MKINEIKMMKNSILKSILSIGVLFLTLTLNAQNDKHNIKESYQKVKNSNNKTALKTLELKFNKEEAARKKRVLEYLKTNKEAFKLSNPNKKGFSQLQDVGVDGTLYYYSTNNIDASKSTRTNFLNSNGGLGLNLDGDDMLVHVWDGGPIKTDHQEFDGAGGNNRVSIGDGLTVINSNSDHAQHVTGTIVASGFQPNAKGMSWKGDAKVYEWNNDVTEVTAEAANGMILSNHSYARLTSVLSDEGFGKYDSKSRNFDEIMYNAPYYLTVTGAGNDGALNNNGTPLDGQNNRDKLPGWMQTSKNSLCVANAQDANIDSNGNLVSVSINSSSSQGPTDDYRIKPDITGNGTFVYSSIVSTFDPNATDLYASYTGTSMASPNVCGSLLLLQEHSSNLNGEFMKAATLKGLALHTADDAGMNGPDPVFGWGLMNTKRAVQVMDASNANNSAIVKELTLNEGDSYSIPIQSNNMDDLQVSISWTDPAGVVNSGVNNTTPILVNDLDVRLDKNGTTTFTPWKLTGVNANGTGDNAVDPYERIDVQNASGVYVVTVTHKGILQSGAQNFSLIITGANSIEDNFVTTWQIDNPNTTITIPTSGSGFDYTVKWGDGTATSNVTGNATHTYANPGTYNVAIGGDFPRILFNNTATDRDKIIEVKHWGNIQWESMENAFYGCSNLKITAGESPDLQLVTNLNNSFNGISELESSIASWDVSTMTSMNGTFKDVNAFNHNIGSWNVSNVTDMTNMFSGVTIPTLIYDDILIGWHNLGSLQNNVVFDAGNSTYCTAIQERNNLITAPNLWTINDGGTVCNTSDFITRWRTTQTNETIVIPTYTSETYNYSVNWGDGSTSANVTGDANHTYAEPGEYLVSISGDFKRIYFKNSAHKEKILAVEQWGNSEWSNMREAFYQCSNLIISTSDKPDLYDVSNMSFMFYGATSLVDGIESWNVSRVDNMDSLFEGATHFNGGIGFWNVGDVDRMSRMFYDAKSFNKNIGNWNVSTVDLMINMFRGASSFNQDISNWNVVTVDRMNGMFYGATNFNQNISGWNTGNVTDMSYMFTQAENFNFNIGDWDVSSVGNMGFMFNGALAFDQNLGDWDISNVTSMQSMFFNNALSVDNYDATLIGWSTLDTAGGETQIPNGITFRAGDSKYCFGESNRELLNVTYGWTILDAGSDCSGSSKSFNTTWKTDNATSSPNTQINIPVDALSTYNYTIYWGDGSKTTNVTGAAQHDYATPGTYTISIIGDFPRIYFNNSGDKNKILSVDQWSTSNWTSMEDAFNGCSNLVINTQESPNFSGVTSLKDMFLNATSITTGFSNWNVNSITDMTNLFKGADNFNDDLTNWNVSQVTSTKSMFRGTKFNYDISNWNVSSVINMESMFHNATDFNYGLNPWNVSLVTTMKNMFNNAQNFNRNLKNWDVSSVSDMTGMLSGSGLTIDKYDATLIGWSELPLLQNNVTLDANGLSYCASYSQRQNMIGSYTWTITDAGRACPVTLSPKVYLQGASLNPIVGEETLMRDDLRTAGFIPTVSPYNDHIKMPSSVLNVTGNNAIVDWIWVELRDANDATIIIDGQSALVQRDGDIVSSDGNSNIGFNQSAGNYFTVIKHRNHLGIMSAVTKAFSNTVKTVNFSDANNVITYGTNAQATFGMPLDKVGMWAGNVNGDTIVQYSGTTPDAPSILSNVLNDSGNFLNFPTYVVTGYNVFDIDMNGETQYSGTNPDTPFVLQNTLNHPGNFLNFSTYAIEEQLPEN